MIILYLNIILTEMLSEKFFVNRVHLCTLTAAASTILRTISEQLCVNYETFTNCHILHTYIHISQLTC